MPNFETSKVKTTSNLFSGCEKLVSINLSNFDTSSVQDISYMFSGCTSLNSFYIPNFITSLVTNMEGMFQNCYSLNLLNISNFDTSSNMKSLFSGCKNLTSLDITNFKTDKVKDMSLIFNGCSSLLYLNLSNFDSSSVTAMNSMFYTCSSLTSIDITNFNNGQVKNMNNMFYQCNSLNSLNLSKFYTSSVTTMSQMFYNCKKLSSLDISNFDVSSVTNFESMFRECSSLKSLNLSNFYTPKGKTMKYMFNGCSSLKELNLLNFDISSITTLYGMFNGCTNLKYINLNNSIETINLKSTTSMFYSVPINIAICIDIYNNTNIYNLIDKILCPLIDCSSNWKKYQKKIILGNNRQCFDNCNETEKNKYEYDNICYEECPNGTYPNIFNICEIRNISFETDYIFSTNIDLLNSDSSIINDYTKSNSVYNYINITNISNYISHIQIYDNDFMSYLNSTNLNEENKYLNSYNNTKIETFINIYTNKTNISYNNYEPFKDYSNNKELFKQTDTPYKNNELFYDYSNYFIGLNNTELFYQIQNFIQEYSISDNKNIIIKGESDFIYQITTTDKEKELINANLVNMDYNISMIDFTECEQLLKEEYNINQNLSLIILKMEKMTDKSSEKNIQYQIYEPINNTLLNISICKNTEIKMYIPLTLKGESLTLYQDLKENGYNLFDKNDKFYNDICTPYTHHTGTDVPLSARQKYIYSEYGNVCQENCQFSNYSINTKFVSCTCKTNNELIEPNKEDKFNPKILYQSFFDILKYSNYKVLACYNLVFNNKIFISNKGSIIVIIYFSIYLGTLILFIIKGISSIKITCSELKENQTINNNAIKCVDNIMIKDNSNAIKLVDNIIIKPNRNAIKEEKNNIMNKNYNNIKQTMNNIKKRRRRKPIVIFDNPPVKRIITNNLNDNQNNEKISKYQLDINEYDNNKENYSSFRNALKSKRNNNEKDISVYIPKIYDINEKVENEELSNYELNNLEYEDSIKLDHRNFYQIYWSILKREHLILFTFFSSNDDNILSIKLTRFIFLVCTDMALNVFFFSDDTMNTIFLTYGKYDFIQKIPQFIYSVIISQLLEILICFLSLTDKYIYQIKSEKNKSFVIINKVYKIIKIKLFIFFVVTFILYIFFWYLISAFCAVYKNTQIIFIKDSIISFITGLIYPFILYLLPSCLRIICLKYKETSLKFLFLLSNIIPIF